MKTFIQPRLQSQFGVVYMALSVIVLTSCFENPEKAQLTSEKISSTGNEMIIRTDINSDGGSEIFQKGICISATPNPTLATGHSIEGSGSSSYESIVLGSPTETIYARAYAINGAGISYGNSLSLSLVEVTIVDYGDITGTSAFFNMRANSAEAITSKGLCWATTPNPTIDGNKTNEGPGDGLYTTTLSDLTPGTTYYARPYATSDDGVFYGGEVNFQTDNFPTVTTKAIQNINTFIPTSGGIVVSNGNSPIVENGICYGTQTNPTVNDSKTIDYLNYLDQTFDSEFSDLQPSTIYYVRAYATNTVGTAYGNQVQFTTPAAALTDADGNHYSSVTIGTQVWTVENLKSTKYADGDPIQLVTEPADWRNLTTGGCSYPDAGSAFEYPYGKVYNWYAVSDPRNVCPTGWHYPSDDEWETLAQFLGGTDVAGGKLKESGTVRWNTPNTGATNSSGFTAIPAGSKSGDFSTHGMGESAIFWSVSETSSTNASSYYLWTHSASMLSYSYVKQFGFSVRCIKD